MLINLGGSRLRPRKNAAPGDTDVAIFSKVRALALRLTVPNPIAPVGETFTSAACSRVANGFAVIRTAITPLSRAVRASIKWAEQIDLANLGQANAGQTSFAGVFTQAIRVKQRNNSPRALHPAQTQMSCDWREKKETVKRQKRRLKLFGRPARRLTADQLAAAEMFPADEAESIGDLRRSEDKHRSIVGRRRAKMMGATQTSRFHRNRCRQRQAKAAGNNDQTRMDDEQHSKTRWSFRDASFKSGSGWTFRQELRRLADAEGKLNDWSPTEFWIGAPNRLDAERKQENIQARRIRRTGLDVFRELKTRARKIIKIKSSAAAKRSQTQAAKEGRRSTCQGNTVLRERTGDKIRTRGAKRSSTGLDAVALSKVPNRTGAKEKECEIRPLTIEFAKICHVEWQPQRRRSKPPSGAAHHYANEATPDQLKPNTGAAARRPDRL